VDSSLEGSGTAPHPVTGAPFPSPVPPGTGWPEDPAGRDTPVAGSAEEVRALARSAGDLATLEARISVCRACPRLVDWRESVARSGRRASFADQPYWGRPGPSFGDPRARVLLVGLAPAANGTNRTGRMFTGDSSGEFLYASLHRTGWAAHPVSVATGDGQSLTGMRIVAAVRCAPPANHPTSEERTTCAPWLSRELDLAGGGLAALLCLGGIAWDATVSAARSAGWVVPRPKPRFGHAVRATLVTPSGHEVALVGCYHVSPHNTYTGRLTPAMLDDLLVGLRTDSDG
jgi:uracil-DNA glycosylase family 4